MVPDIEQHFSLPVLGPTGVETILGIGSAAAISFYSDDIAAFARNVRRMPENEARNLLPPAARDQVVGVALVEFDVVERSSDPSKRIPAEKRES